MNTHASPSILRYKTSARFTEDDFDREARAFIAHCNAIVPPGLVLPPEIIDMPDVEAARSAGDMLTFRREIRAYLDRLREFVRSATAIAITTATVRTTATTTNNGN